jgi:hypothetical protein
LATDFRTLLALWSKERRAKGGWWALAGFSLQSALYLSRFFEGISVHNKTPTELARTELLSDILVPKSGKYVLTQVKRTLDRPKLAAAVHEAYDIATLCDSAFLDSLQFKIACLHLDTIAAPKDLTLQEVVGDDGDPELFKRVVELFGDDAIVEEADALDRLHDLLWHLGIHDAAGFVDRCLGVLLRLFEDPSETSITRIANDLNSTFHFALGLGIGRQRRVGVPLGPEDVKLVDDAVRDHSILFDRRPQLTDLRLGRIRPRPDIFRDLVAQHLVWWKVVVAAEEVRNVPIFWIDGRSGEGKSVLLLQLAQYILSGPRPPNVSYLSPDELPTWIKSQKDMQRGQHSAGWIPSVAVVDDLHLVGDRDEWRRKLAEAVDLIMPRVAVLACGPTPERERFVAEFSICAVEPFTVPLLSAQEMREFHQWYAARTSKSLDLRIDDTANRMLVIWIFELMQGESLREFADSFKRRLIAFDIFEPAHAIVAANALDFPAPAELIRSLSDAQRDAFDALCVKHQLHFSEARSDEGYLYGYRLSHPQINWRLFCEWVTPPTTIAQDWGRALARCVKAAAQSLDWELAGSMIHNLGLSSRLDAGSVPNRHNGTLNQALTELYRIQSNEFSLAESMRLLPRWLDILLKQPNLELAPDPIEVALAVSLRQPIPSDLPPYVAGWLWRIADLERFAGRRSEFYRAAENVILQSPGASGVDASVVMIAAWGSDRTAALGLSKRWLQNDSRGPQSFGVYSALVARWPHEDEILEGAWQWLQTNPNHPKADHVLAPLILARPGDERLMTFAVDWINNGKRSNRPVGYSMLEPLLSARPEDRRVRGVALEWVAENWANSIVYQGLVPLVAAWQVDDEVGDVAERWIRQNPTHPLVPQVLVPLLASRSENEQIRDLAVGWIQANPEHRLVHESLVPLAKAWPNNNRVRQVIVNWVRENIALPTVYRPLMPLLAAHPDDREVRELAVEWVRRNFEKAMAYQLLVPLVKARPLDDAIRDSAFDWIGANSTHPNAYWLLATLVAARPGDPQGLSAALKWAEDNLTHQEAYWLLASLVAARQADDHVIAVALEWLDRNQTHPKAYHLLTPLVAARSSDSRVLSAVRFWFKRYPKETKADALVVTLIKRSDGADEWMKEGERFLISASGSARRAVLLALLAGSKVDAIRLERVLDAIREEANPKARRSGLMELSRILANNLSNSLKYIASDSGAENRKMTAQALSHGLKFYANRSEEFLAIINVVPKEFVGVLLAGCVLSKASDDALTPILLHWLNEFVRAPGYRAVLTALKEAPIRWQALLNTGHLRPEVQADYESPKRN